ncbi:MAG: hypothetical protein DI590_23740 [Methylorubrum populi]|nr:MAG: hypothetical protein DI590_23740 [Methylorubrum populi]
MSDSFSSGRSSQSARSKASRSGHKEYGGLQFDKAGKMKDLERENARLRRLVADLSLVKHAPSGGGGNPREVQSGVQTCEAVPLKYGARASQ